MYVAKYLQIFMGRNFVAFNFEFSMFLDSTKQWGIAQGIVWSYLRSLICSG